MKEIKLTRGFVALVDDEDFEDLTRWKWHAKTHTKSRMVYAVRTETIGIRADGKRQRREVKMHRQILGCIGSLDGEHRNRNGLDNRRENLRPATRSQNQFNRGLNRNNTTGSKGVTFHKASRKWYSRLRLEGEPVHQRLFETPAEAASAYNQAARERVGEFAYLNTF